jgi:hypothetical protein
MDKLDFELGYISLDINKSGKWKGYNIAKKNQIINAFVKNLVKCSNVHKQSYLKKEVKPFNTMGNIVSQ